MKLIGKPELEDFQTQHADARSHITSLITEIEDGQWKTPHELKEHYPKAKTVGDKNVIFKICGNKYRLWVKVAYKTLTVFVKKIGTHREYDAWDIK